MSFNKEASEYLLDKIERIEVFEEKLGIRYEGISVNANYEDIDNTWTISVLGDILENENGNLDNFRDSFIHIVVNLYDDKNRIIQTDYWIFDVENYLGFTTFEVTFYYLNSIEEINKIRIFPEIS